MALRLAFTLATELKKVARKQRVRIKIRESRRVSTQNKKEFIAGTIEPLTKVGRLYISEHVWYNTMFKEELIAFPDGQHDDFIDSTAGAINALRKARVGYNKHKPLVSQGIKAQPTVTQVSDWSRG